MNAEHSSNTISRLSQTSNYVYCRHKSTNNKLSDKNIIHQSWTIAIATLISRITGFLRILLLTTVLGGHIASAFSIANQLPSMITALVFESTLSAVFTPLLVHAELNDADGGIAFIRRMFTLVVTLLMLTTLISIILTPLLVKIMLSNQSQVNFALTKFFAYLLLPQILFYGLSSTFMTILNTKNIFVSPAWAPVINNLLFIIVLVIFITIPNSLIKNSIKLDLVKLLILGIGTTLSVAAQCCVLFISIRNLYINLKFLWELDNRLKKLGNTFIAVIFYVLVNQLGLIVSNRIASNATASGPVIYNYTWLILMLPFGIFGVTVLTVIMPRLSRNAISNNISALTNDYLLAIRLTLLTMLPVVTLATVSGPLLGSTLFAYGNFSLVEARYLGIAITMSAFSLIPYAFTILQLRIFYARNCPWEPILVGSIITFIKVTGSLLIPYITCDPILSIAYLGVFNGIGFIAGALMGYIILNLSFQLRLNSNLQSKITLMIIATTIVLLTAAAAARVMDQLLGLYPLVYINETINFLIHFFVVSLLIFIITFSAMFLMKVPEVVISITFIRNKSKRLYHLLYINK